MHKQDKATTEKHARILRELVKHPENKTCADCKRQDARWSSWNIGVFICIRCSGIHRSMGTHVSKVKSVDLDTWTPEQMESIQKWGNHRANLYWEAHLRPGHVPPEHKLDSFVRSKYESRRWAREGPPPDDPSTLETSETVHTAPGTSTSSIPTPASPPSSAPPAVTSRQPQPHRLLSATLINRSSAPQAATTPVIVQEAEPPEENDLFSLDFHAPAPSTNHQRAEPIKDVKSDILSLFSAPSSTAAVAPTPNTLTRQWGQATPAPHAQSQSISMMGTTGTAMWGAQSGWMPAAPSAQSDLWGGLQGASPAVPEQPNTQNIFETQSVWSSANSNNTTAATSHGLNGAALTNAKKDDVFGDIWGDFK